MVPDADNYESKRLVHFFDIDEHLSYIEGYRCDDGALLDMRSLATFCQDLKISLEIYPVVCCYSSWNSCDRTNAVMLMCAYQIMDMGRTTEEAFRGFQHYAPHEVSPRDDKGSNPPISSSLGLASTENLSPFHNSFELEDYYELTVMEYLTGLEKALRSGFWDRPSFDASEDERFLQSKVRFDHMYTLLAILVFSHGRYFHIRI